jgi:tetratricopeptide (TPR) repeat protein
VLSRAYLVLSLADLGHFDEAEAVGEEAVRLAEELDPAHSYAVASHALGIALVFRGDLDRAVPMLERTLVRCQVGHIPLGSRLLASALGHAYVLTGRVSEGVELLAQAVRQAEALKVVFRYALWLAWLGEGYLLAGGREEAARLAERAGAWAATRGESGHQAYAFRLAAEIAARQDPPDAMRATEALTAALALARQLGMRPLEAHCRLGLAALYRRTGDDRARGEEEAAVALYRSMRMTSWLRRVEERQGDRAGPA